ncbi:adenylyltransferase/cytidyltransferase family protein [Microgenomates group bacterium]|nr:adenylyltransferase/cytidyltransferase family protein [Microgenomates group bacterium]
MTKQHYQGKILRDKEELIRQMAEAARAVGKKVVLTAGSFDLLHIGHGRYLQEAKTHGDVLFVGVDADEKVRVRKGPERPIVPEEERMEMLSYLDSVDYVILKPLQKEKWWLIKLMRPDVLIATRSTYSEEQKEKLREWCGEVVVLKEQATTSTSAKIRRVQIGAAKRITKTLSNKLIKSMEQALEELRVS